MKKCYFCNGDIEKKSIDFDFWWEGDLVVFQKVPALVCQQCGEKYFLSKVSKKMKELARKAMKKEIKFRDLSVPLISYGEAIQT